MSVEAANHIDVSCIVLIENRLLGHKLTQGLRSQSFLFYEAGDITEAISTYNQFDPDLILVEGNLLFSKPGLATKLRKTMPNIMIAAVGDAHKLHFLHQSGAVDFILGTPFAPESVPAKLMSSLFPERSTEMDANAIFGERKWKRFTVKDVRVRFYHPVYEMTDVLDLSYLGLRANTEIGEEIGTSSKVKMEVISPRGNFNLEGTVSWIKESQIGIMFSKPKPRLFREFIRKISFGC